MCVLYIYTESSNSSRAFCKVQVAADRRRRKPGGRCDGRQEGVDFCCVSGTFDYTATHIDGSPNGPICEQK
jgi:hypothetical protein